MESPSFAIHSNNTTDGKTKNLMVRNRLDRHVGMLYHNIFYTKYLSFNTLAHFNMLVNFNTRMIQELALVVCNLAMGEKIVGSIATCIFRMFCLCVPNNSEI